MPSTNEDARSLTTLQINCIRETFRNDMLTQENGHMNFFDVSGATAVLVLQMAAARKTCA